MMVFLKRILKYSPILDFIQVMVFVYPKRSCNILSNLEDGRLSVPHIAMPTFMEVMQEYLLSIGVVFEFNTPFECWITAPMGDLLIDARPRRYAFDSPHKENQERWEPFNGAKLFFNVRDVNAKIGNAALSFLEES